MVRANTTSPSAASGALPAPAVADRPASVTAVGDAPVAANKKWIPSPEMGMGSPDAVSPLLNENAPPALPAPDEMFVHVLGPVYW